MIEHFNIIYKVRLNKILAQNNVAAVVLHDYALSDARAPNGLTSPDSLAPNAEYGLYKDMDKSDWYEWNKYVRNSTYHY